MAKYDVEECKKFYIIAKERMQKGFSEDAIFAGKPSGFSDWLKDTYPDRKIKKESNKFSLTLLFIILFLY